MEIWKVEREKEMSNFHKREEKCRVCHHLIEYHALFHRFNHGHYAIDSVINVLEFVPCNDSVYDNSYPPVSKDCSCPKFMPEDNLEYLEMKYEENSK